VLILSSIFAHFRRNNRRFSPLFGETIGYFCRFSAKQSAILPIFGETIGYFADFYFVETMGHFLEKPITLSPFL
jgi:hypothetical protein